MIVKRQVFKQAYIFCLVMLSLGTYQCSSDKPIKKPSKAERVAYSNAHFFEATKDPALGYPPIERLVAAKTQAKLIVPKKKGALSIQAKGPNDIGGRTRALVFDPNDPTHKKVWAGGVSGGLWFNSDITSESSSWQLVDGFWSSIGVTAIAIDPQNTSVMYVGTGEGYGVGSLPGDGIWKTTDGGANWSHLQNSSFFTNINDLVVRVENGTSTLYVAAQGDETNKLPGKTTEGLFKSENGGKAFSQILSKIDGNNYAISDIELGADNRIYVGTINNTQGKGGGKLWYSDNGKDWTERTLLSEGDRVELATAPSDARVLYALVEKKFSLGATLKSTDKGSTWVNTGDASEFVKGQAWYDLIAKVDPNNTNTVYAGGVKLGRSTDGGKTWSGISRYPSHPDYHNIIFRNGSSSEAVICNDGGVVYSTNINSSKPSFQERELDYITTQLFSCAIHPQKGKSYFVVGAQDNGSSTLSGSGIVGSRHAYGGDGAYCFIDQKDPNYQIVSHIGNTYHLSTDGGIRFKKLPNSGGGMFINPADYDSNRKILFSTLDNTEIQRIKNITGTPSNSNLSVKLGNSFRERGSAYKVSPYTTTSSTLFVGTTVGKLFRINNADTDAPKVKEITGADFPKGYINCVELGRNEKEILVIFSNYGVNSVWFSNDGGASWQEKDGDLPDMPIWWGVFNPLNPEEVLLATEVGIWNTTNFSAESPAYTPQNDNLAQVRTTMIRVREADNHFAVASYGRGLFTGVFQSTKSDSEDVDNDGDEKDGDEKDGDEKDGDDEEKTLGVNTESVTISVYPNPATSFINISGITGQASVTIYDVNGFVVERTQLVSSKTPVSVSHLAKGIYFLSIKNQEGDVMIKKLVKK